MRQRRMIIKTTVLICACFILFSRAGTKSLKSREKRISTWDLIRKQKIQKTKEAESPAEEHKSTKPQVKERIVRFSKEKSLGRLKIQDTNAVRNIQTFFYWTEAGDSEWEYLAEAGGDVIVPVGKRLALEVNEYGWRNLSGLSSLKPDDLYKLDVPGPYPDGPRPDDRIMPYIARLTGLKSLGFGNTNISAKGLKYLNSLTSLERLHIKGLANDGLAEIAQLSSLKGLYLNEHRLTDKGMVYLEQMKSLEELDISGGHLGNPSLAYVAKLTSLRYLLLNGEGFTDAGMAYIKNSPSLRILHFGYLKSLTDAALVHLSQMPRLERLALHWNENITDAGITHLTQLKSLTMLDIKHARITDEGLANLAKIQTLENLTLPDAGITDAGIEHIAQLHNLRYLWSSSSPLTNKSLHYISALENLEELNIGGKSFSDDGMKDIAKLKKLRQLTIFTADQLTNDGLGELAVLESLTNFSLGSKTNVSVSGLKSLNSLKKLKVLTLRDVRQDGSIMDISGLTDLENLTILLHRQRKGKSLMSDSFKNEDWACLANLTKIKRLQITGVGIDNEGIKHLSGLINLEFLNIFCPGESKINDQALKYLRNMHKLNRLYIKDGHFTDKALDYLDGLPALSWLELTSDFAFSDNAIRDFRRKNPMVTRLQLMP
jgi:Leucine-rich repeat (LRR) protein